jgi:hypothetical protein
MNPLLNVKAIPSYYLVKEAIKQQPKSLIESSS